MAGARDRAAAREGTAVATRAATGRENSNLNMKAVIGGFDAPPAASTRRALGDIGNLVGALAVRCNVSKDGVVSNKQETSTSWGTKQRRTNATGADVSVKGEVNDEAAENQKAEPEPAVSAPRLRPLTRNARAAAAKKMPTLTATLTARSEAIQKCDTEMLDAEESVHNIDEGDTGNQLCVVDYVEDIYSFYRKTEVQSCVAPDYMCRQSDINEKMRAILIDWLIEVHLKFGLMPETLFLTTNLIDRYLSLETVSRKTLQLVGVTAMLLAAKYEEIIAPEVEAIVFISDDAYTRQQVLAMEKAMLNTLRFNLTVPTPYVFMVRFLKAASSDKKMDLLSFFLVELCLTEYGAVRFPPSLLAAAAVYTAHHTLQRLPCWTSTLHRYSGYVEVHLKDCAKLMTTLHRQASTGNLLVVHKKYSSSSYQSVATLSPAIIPGAVSIV